MSTVSYHAQALTHLSLYVQLAADSARPRHGSASASEEFWKAATYALKMTLPLVLKQSATEHHRRSLYGQAELKGWMVSRAIHYLKAEYLRRILQLLRRITK